MSIADSDVEILEVYLDGELPIADAEGLWHRLSVEPELSAALDELRAQRSVRLSAYTQMEPSALEERQVCGDVVRGMRRRNVWERVRGAGKWLTAAAAVLAIGFSLGRMRVTPATSLSSSGNSVAMTGNNNALQPAGHNLYQVGYFDPNGKLIAVQPFNSLEDANNFVNDVNTWQTENHVAPEGSDTHESPIVPVSDNEWR